MVLKWIHSVVGGASAEAIQKGAHEETKRIRKMEGRDIAHEVIKLRAKERGQELDGLIQKGVPVLKREQFKSCVHKRVFEIVSRNFNLRKGDFADEVTEEITESIVSAADFDPTYREMFEEK